MAINVNLDALIRRADFDIVESTSQSAPPQTMQIRDLEGDSFFYSGLRKPDFLIFRLTQTKAKGETLPEY